LLLSTNLPGATVDDLVEVLAGTVVEATCEKAMLPKNASKLKVKNNLDAVFMV
jgi:hypothetical protein